MENSREEKTVQRMFGRLRKLDPKDTFIEKELYEESKNIIENQLGIYEYQDPKYKRHRCKLLKKVKLPDNEIDFMVYGEI